MPAGPVGATPDEHSTRLLVPLVLLFLSIAAPASAQTIRGHVFDATTGAGVAQAEVALIVDGSTSGSTLSDDDGAFTLRLPRAGTYSLRATRLGYAPSESAPLVVGARELIEVTMRLSPAAVALDPIVVTGRRSDPLHMATYEGLYARREVVLPVGGSRVVVAGDYQLDNAARVSDVLRWFVPADGCIVYFVNGRPQPARMMNIDGFRYVEEMSATFLEGVEFYRDGFTAPLDYQGYGCWEATRYSIIAVWLRR